MYTDIIIHVCMYMYIRMLHNLCGTPGTLLRQASSSTSWLEDEPLQGHGLN